MADTDTEMEKPRILIVDDSPDDIALISELLKDLYKINIAGNGEQALKIARSGKPPDLILLDIMMPVMDGYETCLRLKENPETLNVPVIFLTSKTELEDEMKGFELGAVDYIAKPISPPIVLARVQTHLQLKRIRDYLKDKNAFLEDEVNRRIQMITQAKRDWERTFDAVPDLIMLLDKDHRILRANRAMAEPFGKTCQELIGHHCYEVVHGLPDPPQVCPHTRLLDSHKEERSEFMEKGLGLFLDVRTTPLYDEDREFKGSVHIVRDITERKQAEHQIKERMKELQAFFTLSKLISRENITIEELLQEFCNSLPSSWQYPEITCIRIVIGDREYCTNNFMESAWMQSANIIRSGKIYGHIDVVYLEERPAIDEGPFMREERLLIDSLAERLGRLLERNRAEADLLKSEILNRRLVEHLPHRVFVKDRNSAYLSCNTNYARDLGITPEQLVGKSSLDVYPAEFAEAFIAEDHAVMDTGQMLESEERRIVAGQERWMHKMKVPFRDDQGNIMGVVGVFEDITDRKQAEERLQRTLESLRKAVGTTVQVISCTVEARDPYTAGHQIRSADLARAIATELGLPQDKIEGIRMAGSIHDIGKISIPSEILTKPTRLTDLEFAMIKEHAQRGYEILKDVESPWPLAESVYQHHERMDGSGYPRNLKGEEILLEARILTVADVVEAMASHRPYRPALGIDAALQEIVKNSGIYYDSAVSDACLRLFREKGFKLAGT